MKNSRESPEKPAAIVELKCLRRKPNQAAIKVLEDLLEEAKSGSVTGVFCIATFGDGSTGRRSGGYWAVADAVYGLEAFKHLLIEEYVKVGE